MWTRGAMRGTPLAAWAIVLATLWLGVMKVFVGLSRGRPVMWLLMEMALFGIVYWWVTARLIGVGRAGPTAGPTRRSMFIGSAASRGHVQVCRRTIYCG